MARTAAVARGGLGRLVADGLGANGFTAARAHGSDSGGRRRLDGGGAGGSMAAVQAARRRWHS